VSVIWHITMSLDGFIAGPDDSMDWLVAEWSDDGRDTRDVQVERSTVANDVLASAGAILGGRRWYDVATRRYHGVAGIYGGKWTGPVFVITHRPPDDDDPSVTFISDGIEHAVAAANAAAAGKNVIAFGANVARQCLRAGLLDEIVVHLAPVLLGDGVRMFEAGDMKPVGLTRTTLAASGQIVDLRFDVRR
jgi:dihydrofolate reductase